MCRVSGRSFVLGRISSPSPSIEHVSGWLPLKKEVSTSMRLTIASAPSSTSTQSLPGPRRREILLFVKSPFAVPFRNDLAMNAQASHAAVGINVKSKMRKGVRILDRKEIFGVALQFRLRKHFDPVGERVMLRLGRRVACFDRAVRRKIAAEIAGVDHHAAQNAGESEANDGVIVAGDALAAALPSVHPFPALGVVMFLPHRLLGAKEILLGREEIVGGVQHRSAEAFGGPVH